MELEKKTVKKHLERGRAFSQITLEDDPIVPDSKPDVLKVIHTWGTIRFEEPKISSQALWVNGRLEFHVLYRSENEDSKLEQLEGAIPFQEKLSMEGLEETDQIRLRGRIEDLTVSIINSRKLALRSVVDIMAAAENSRQQELAVGLADEEGYQICRRQKTMLDLVYSQKDVLRIRRELELPAVKPNIEKLLFQCVDVTNVECSLEPGNVIVQGEARICVLYQAAGGEELCCFETTEAFEEKAESRLTEISGINWVVAEPGTAVVEAREDYDGEQRVLAFEMDFDIQAKVWKEENIPVMTDLYAPDRVVNPKRSTEILQRLLLRNQTKVRLAEQFSLEKEQEKIMQICCFSGEIHTERAALEEDGLMVEGTLCVQILYMTGDEYLPIAHLKVYLPFEQMVELPSAEGKVSFELSTNIEQLQVNLLDPAKFEVKSLLSLEVIAFEEELFDSIREIEEAPLDEEELRRQPGIVGYTVQEGQRLWDIAREYHTTVEKIMEINQLEEENLTPGQKLLIVKEV